MALVLDGGHGTLGGPVDGSRDGIQVGGGLVHELSSGLRGSIKTKAGEVTVLLNGQMRELVVAKLVRLALGVVVVDVVLVISEVLKHLHEVHTVHGLDLVSLEPVEELLLVVGAVVHVGRHSGSLNSFKK